MNKKNNFRFYVIFYLLVAASVVSWNLYFRVLSEKDTVDIKEFPKTLPGGWTSTELPITELEYNILETKNAFTRLYESVDGKKIFLFIVYSQNNRKVSHPPEVCYTGSGLTITNSRGVEIDLPGDEKLEVKKLLLERGNSQQSVFYWFKVGDNFTPNYWRQQFLITFNTLLGKPSSSALIRISAPIENDNKALADQSIKEFIFLTLPLIKEYLP